MIGSWSDLESNLHHFTRKKYKNNIKEEIDLYVPKQKLINFSFKNFEPSSIFVKISDHFYMLYTYQFLDMCKSNETFERLDWL